MDVVFRQNDVQQAAAQKAGTDPQLLGGRARPPVTANRVKPSLSEIHA